MSDAAVTPETVSAVMSELASRRWRGVVSKRLVRELGERLDELSDEDRAKVLNALMETRGGSAA
jgi:hypothetical protein